MEANALSARETVGWRPGKKPRAESRVLRGATSAADEGAVAAPGGGRQRAFEKHKRDLLAREQEKERRHAEEAIQRLGAIEEQRRRERARKIEREKRRAAFADLLERSAITLQRVERGRQIRREKQKRTRAALQVGRWMRARCRQVAMMKAVRNRKILCIMMDVKSMAAEHIEEVCFVIKNLVLIRTFTRNHAAGTIQKFARERARRVRHARAVIVRNARWWLARRPLRRARLRRSILRHGPSLSRRAPSPMVLSTSTALSSTKTPMATGAAAPNTAATAELPEVCWWDTGTPVVQRPVDRWGMPRVEQEEARSRGRAASLAELIRTGGAGARNTGSPPGGKQTGVDRYAGVGRRVASMVDPREAERAAFLDAQRRRREREEADALEGASGVSGDKKKLSVLEKHVLREREFQAAQEKRRLTAEKEARRKEKLRCQEAAEAAKHRQVRAETLRQQEEERTQRRLNKIRKFQRKKASKEAADRKALAAKAEQERQAKEHADEKRRAAEAAFEKERADRLERVIRRKRRAVAAETTDKKGKGANKHAPNTSKKEGSRAESSVHYCEPRRGKRSSVTRMVLAPIAVGGNRERQRRKRTICLRASREDEEKDERGGVEAFGEAVATRPKVVACAPSSFSSSCRHAATSLGILGGTEAEAGPRGHAAKTSPLRRHRRSASSSALPVVPSWKATVLGSEHDNGDRKRREERPPQRRIVGEFEKHLAHSVPMGLATVGGGTSVGDVTTERGPSITQKTSTARANKKSPGRQGERKGEGRRWKQTTINGRSVTSVGVEKQQRQRQKKKKSKSNQKVAATEQGKCITKSLAVAPPVEELMAQHDLIEESYLPALPSTDVSLGRRRSGDRDVGGGSGLASDEALTMETLDSAFPAPGPEAESGGGAGLGATSAEGTVLSPGWSSRSSRSSGGFEFDNGEDFRKPGKSFPQLADGSSTLTTPEKETTMAASYAELIFGDDQHPDATGVDNHHSPTAVVNSDYYKAGACTSAGVVVATKTKTPLPETGIGRTSMVAEEGIVGHLSGPESLNDETRRRNVRDRGGDPSSDRVTPVSPPPEVGVAAIDLKEPPISLPSTRDKQPTIVADAATAAAESGTRGRNRSKLSSSRRSKGPDKATMCCSRSISRASTPNGGEDGDYHDVCDPEEEQLTVSSKFVGGTSDGKKRGSSAVTERHIRCGDSTSMPAEPNFMRIGCGNNGAGGSYICAQPASSTGTDRSTPNDDDRRHLSSVFPDDVSDLSSQTCDYSDEEYDDDDDFEHMEDDGDGDGIVTVPVATVYDDSNWRQQE